MKNISIWRDEKIDEGKVLNENIKCDVLIIGGGMTGLSTAYFLKDKGFNVCLVEKNYIGNGVTTKSTGKITYLQDILKDINNLEYIKSQIDACNLIKEIIEEEKIDCDYEAVYHYLFSSDKTKLNNIYKKIKKYAEWDKDKLRAKSAVFNPFKFLRCLKDICLKSRVQIFENTGIIKIDKNKMTAYTNKYKIIYKKCVVATHYPSLVKFLFLPTHSYLEKAYLMAKRVNDNKKECGISIDKDSKSFRYYKDYYLSLDNVSDTSMNYDIALNFNKLIKSNANVNVNVNADYVWSNKDIMTIDHMPYIGEVLDNIYIGTGYNTWGMTNGFLAGRIISSLICGENSKYKDLFDPKRLTNIKNYIKFPLFMGISMKAFIKSKLYNSNFVSMKEIEGINYLIYKDKSGMEHIVRNICPHLKCGIIFNSTEEIWECPCHGSKFDIDGKCIEGPSNKDISFKIN